MRYRQKAGDREYGQAQRSQESVMSRLPRNTADEAARGATLQTVDPATGENGKAYPSHTLDEARSIAADCAAAQKRWRQTLIVERAKLMHAAAQVMRTNKSRYAKLMTSEMGKTVSEGLAEIEKCAWTADYFADRAAALLAPRPQDLSDGHAGGGPLPRAFVTFNPLGVVLAVMPWNFPFWQAMRFCAPHLMAGNGGVLKHASNVPGCALALEEIFREAGFPRNLFRTVLVGSQQVNALIEDPSIAAVTLTGSVNAGKAVAAAAGAVLKKTVLELGGSDGYIVLEDADIERAAKVCAAARMINAGQSCIAGKRFVVVETVRPAFEAAFVEAMRSYVFGDPNDPATRLGPLQSVKARDEIAEQVRRSVALGARLLLGGSMPQRPGAWYPATVLTNVTAGQPAHDEEVFGPVAAIISARDEADAIRIVNDTRFGLGNAVLTRDLARGERIAADELESGLAFVNQSVRSDARLPFGGVKESGYGRELSEFGIYEFCNIKSVFVQEL
jgi:succinate-semialdehyde dehydrogenase/glutarate-semialdehyde dehydrogenase